MKVTNLALAVGLLTALAGVCSAAESATADTTSTRLDALQVTADSLPWAETSLTGAALRARQGDNLAENLEHLPGVAAIRRAAGAAELVVRGLGWERVQTVLGAVPLYGACPGRMDPPATYLDPLATEQVTIDRRGGGAGEGPGGTGGALVAKPDYERAPGAPAGVTPWLATGYESARDGFRFQGGLFGGNDAVDFKIGTGRRKHEDYTAPDGTLVPAGQTSISAGGSLAWRPRAGQRLFYAGTFTHEKNIDFPALPMDNIESDFWAHNLGWRSVRAEGLVRRIAVTGGFSQVDHFMDNSMKPNRGMMEAATEADTRSAAAHIRFDLRPGSQWQLSVGVDATRLARDATRTRLLVASGLTFRDRLWPDAVQTSGGAAASVSRRLTKVWTAALDGRLDVVDSKARAADAASLGGRTVREQYVNYYGTAAAKTDRTETLGQLRLQLLGEFSTGAEAHVRIGLSSRPGGVTERYYAFGPAPGGFQVGDPSLAAEQKWEGEIGGGLVGDHFIASLNGFHARVSDFILPTAIDRRDVNGDGIDDTIKGFANVDASLTGGELGLEYRPAPALSVPVTLSVVRGRNTTADRDLPEIPPLFGTADLRWRFLAVRKVWLRAGCTFAADQNRIDPQFPEDRTGGYAVWHAALESSPGDGWRVGVVVDNLFDRLYHDHLTREAVLPVGGLAAGQEVPAPGRSLRLTARREF